MAKTTSKATEYDHYRVFQEECTAGGFRQIIQKAIGQAKEGNPEARLFVAAYAIGMPKTLDLKLSGIDLAERMQAACDETTAGLFPATKGRK